MPNHTSNQGTKNWNNIEMLFPLVRLKEKWSLPTSSIDEGRKKNGNLIPRWWERVTCQNLIKRKTCVSRGPTILFQHLHPREIPQPVHKWIWLETTWISIRRKKDKSNMGGFQEELLGSNWGEWLRKPGMQSDIPSEAPFMKNLPHLFTGDGWELILKYLTGMINVNYTIECLHQKLKTFSFIL